MAQSMRPFLKMLFAVPGRVGMAECSLDLIFLIRDKPFDFLVWGGGLIFSNSLK